jgi:hypothetical protein
MTIPHCSSGGAHRIPRLFQSFAWLVLLGALMGIQPGATVHASECRIMNMGRRLMYWLDDL